MTGPGVAFYAPMKSPDHPVPSGDREIARLTLRALERAGFAPLVASGLRIFDGEGNAETQDRLVSAAERDVRRLLEAKSDVPPALWFTYHCYYKAPDLVGPVVSARLGIPYVISEPSISPRRRSGPWARFAHASETAIAAADRLFWTTRRDRPALEEAGHAGKMVHLPAFVDPGQEVPARDASAPLRLLTVAMMREGDKLESYRRLARALARLNGATEWRLDVYGDGPVRAEVEALFSGLPGDVVLHGVGEAAAIRQACEQADLMVWPGVGEGVGMVYLEAQAAGLPVVAEDHAAQGEVVFGHRAAPGEAVAFARAILQAAANRRQLSTNARAAIIADHSLDAAARTLGEVLRGLLR